MYLGVYHKEPRSSLELEGEFLAILKLVLFILFIILNKISTFLFNKDG